MNDIGAGSRGVGVKRFGPGEVPLTGEEDAIVADSRAKLANAALKGRDAVRILERGANVRLLEEMRAVPRVPPRHSVDLEEFVTPFVRRDVVIMTQPRDRLVVRRIDRVASVPRRHGRSVGIVQEPILMRVIKLFGARAKGGCPETGNESQGANIVRKRFHPLRELVFIRLEAEIVEIRDGERIGVPLPAFDKPDVESEGLEIFFCDARLRKVVLRRRFVEVDVPGHPPRESARQSFAVDRRVVGNPSLFEIVAVEGRAPCRLGGFVDPSGDAE